MLKITMPWNDLVALIIIGLMVTASAVMIIAGFIYGAIKERKEKKNARDLQKGS